MKRRFETKVQDLMASRSLSRSEACSVLGKRGIRVQKTTKRRRKVVYDRVNLSSLAPVVKNIGRSDIVECLDTGATYTVLEGYDSKGIIMTEDALGIIHPLRADRVKVIAANADNTPMTAEDLAEAWDS